MNSLQYDRLSERLDKIEQQIYRVKYAEWTFNMIFILSIVFIYKELI